MQQLPPCPNQNLWAGLGLQSFFSMEERSGGPHRQLTALDLDQAIPNMGVRFRLVGAGNLLVELDQRLSRGKGAPCIVPTGHAHMATCHMACPGE